MATFDSSIDLRGTGRLLNAMLETNSSNPTLLGGSTDIGGIYFNTDDANIRVKTGASTWYDTLLYTPSTAAFKRLPVLSSGAYGYVEALTNSSSSKFVYLDSAGEIKLAQYITFEQIEGTDIVTTITNSDSVLPTSGAVYDYVASAISALGNYLPLAGGTMAGNITIPTSYKIIFDNASTYIQGTGLGLRLYSIGQTDFYVNGSIVYTVDETGITPQTTGVTLGSGPGTLWLAGYIETIYATTITGMSGGKVTISPEDVLELSGEEGDGLTLYEKALLPVTDVDFTLGSSSKKFSNFYSSVVTTASIVLSGATALTSVNTDITATHTDAQIPTALAVWNLFNTIQPIDTTTETYGTVAASPVNPSDYYLRGDNSWQAIADLQSFWAGEGTPTIDTIKADYIVKSDDGFTTDGVSVWKFGAFTGTPLATTNDGYIEVEIGGVTRYIVCGLVVA
jgi:hypothetical protein